MVRLDLFALLSCKCIQMSLNLIDVKFLYRKLLFGSCGADTTIRASSEDCQRSTHCPKPLFSVIEFKHVMYIFLLYRCIFSIDCIIINV